MDLTDQTDPVAEGAEDSERPSEEAPSFWTSYEAFRREVNLEELDVNPEEVFGDVRDSSPGRDFEW